MAMLNVSQGQTWQQIRFPIPGSAFNGVFFHDTGIIVNAKGYIIHTNDFFQSSYIDSSYKDNFLEAFSFPTREIGYISSRDVQGGFLKTTDRGDNWLPISNGPIGQYIGEVLLFVNPDTGYNGYYYFNSFYTTHDSGMQWSISTIDINCDKIFQIRFLNDSTGFVLCNDDPFNQIRIFRTTNYANTWNQVSALGQRGMSDFYFTDDSTIILCSENFILKSTNQGDSFQTVLQISPPDMYGGISQYANRISFANHDTGYVAYNWSIYKTCDGGSSWFRTNFSFQDSTHDLICFIKSVTPDKVMVGCQSGDIYKTETGGGVWSGIPKYPEVDRSFIISPNPATTKLKCTVNTTAQNTTLQILSLTGQQLLPTQTITQPRFEVDVSSLPAGLYFAVLQNDKERVVRRFVKE